MCLKNFSSHRIYPPPKKWLFKKFIVIFIKILMKKVLNMICIGFIYKSQSLAQVNGEDSENLIRKFLMSKNITARARARMFACSAGVISNVLFRKMEYTWSWILNIQPHRLIWRFSIYILRMKIRQYEDNRCRKFHILNIIVYIFSFQSNKKIRGKINFSSYFLLSI